MIIWIANFPGALNPLFLEALHKRYGLPWYVGDLPDQTDYQPTESNRAIGQRSARGSWRAFYEKALDSERRVLVHTNMLPRDNQPFIYLSRDGVQTIWECARSSSPNEPEADLVRWTLGTHLYANWSSHFKRWKETASTRRGVFVRMEDFVANPESIWPEIDALIGEAKSPETPSPAPPLPAFPPLPPTAAALFRVLHSASARERGYEVADDADLAAHPLAAPEIHQVANELTQAAALTGTVHEMSAYIDSLKAQLAEETERLKDYIEVLKEKTEK